MDFGYAFQDNYHCHDRNYHVSFCGKVFSFFAFLLWYAFSAVVTSWQDGFFIFTTNKRFLAWIPEAVMDVKDAERLVLFILSICLKLKVLKNYFLFNTIFNGFFEKRELESERFTPFLSCFLSFILTFFFTFFFFFCLFIQSTEFSLVILKDEN